MVSTTLPRLRSKHRHHENEMLLFPHLSAPGAVFYRVKFVFMGYHPEDGEFPVTFLAKRIRAKNQNEAIDKALKQASIKYEHLFFKYQKGSQSGSGAFLLYRNGLHTFVRLGSKKEALSRAGGGKCFFIQVKKCPD